LKCSLRDAEVVDPGKESVWKFVRDVLPSRHNSKNKRICKKKTNHLLIMVILLFGGIECAQAQVEIGGVVRDAANREALAFVNVVLQTADSVFVTGTTSNDDGRFVLSNIAPGDYRLLVSSVGYMTQ
jgi:uncharacterized surface anchored protein